MKPLIKFLSSVHKRNTQFSSKFCEKYTKSFYYMSLHHLMSLELILLGHCIHISELNVYDSFQRIAKLPENLCFPIYLQKAPSSACPF